MLPIRHAVRLLLFNDADELLLVRSDDPTTTGMDGKNRGPCWFTIGGGIEGSESILEAAEREAFEEAGILKGAIEFGPVVWHTSKEIILRGVPTHTKHQFILARTKQRELSLEYLTAEEKGVMQLLTWFSLEQIRNCPEPIYPLSLPKHLAELLAGNIPDKPIEIH